MLWGRRTWETWLRAGRKHGWRRRCLAWRRNRFRRNSTIFWTVQSAADAARLRESGEPWPSADTRAHLGEGVCAWDSRSPAQAYLDVLLTKGATNLGILTFRVSDRILRWFRRLDVDALGDPGADEWLNRFSRLRGGVPDHGLHCICRGTQFGVEYFFDRSVFRHLRFE
jgi:hypothetical protein